MSGERPRKGPSHVARAFGKWNADHAAARGVLFPWPFMVSLAAWSILVTSLVGIRAATGGQPGEDGAQVVDGFPQGRVLRPLRGQFLPKLGNYASQPESVALRGFLRVLGAVPGGGVVESRPCPARLLADG